MVKITTAIMLVFLMLTWNNGANAGDTLTIIDTMDRTISVPNPLNSAICSGPGSLRLLTYLTAQDLIVAVDDIEVKRRQFDARPYALANPAFKKQSIFGEFRGFDNPELILSLAKQPQVIFKTFPNIGYDPVELQEKTGIPTVVLEYGNLGMQREELFTSLRIMGKIVSKSNRAEEVINFFNVTIKDLHRRTDSILESKKKACYMGGVAYRGPHGFMSTELSYPPFTFVSAADVAHDTKTKSKAQRQVTLSKEKLIEWDPDVLFLDLSTLQLAGSASGLWEIRNDPALKTLTAVQNKLVYGVLPYNWYTKNYGSVLANAYFIGKILYPERFEDVDPFSKADEIYKFLVGKPVFIEMNAQFDNLAFRTVLE